MDRRVSAEERCDLRVDARADPAGKQTLGAGENAAGG
jgi:hypothetical protein